MHVTICSRSTGTVVTLEASPAVFSPGPLFIPRGTQSVVVATDSGGIVSIIADALPGCLEDTFCSPGQQNATHRHCWQTFDAAGHARATTRPGLT